MEVFTWSAPFPPKCLSGISRSKQHLGVPPYTVTAVSPWLHNLKTRKHQSNITHKINGETRISGVNYGTGFTKILSNFLIYF